jgi:hypothetical protein
VGLFYPVHLKHCTKTVNLSARSAIAGVDNVSSAVAV